MQTERFTILRKKVLSNLFTRRRIIDVWRQVVRSQLRSLDLKDLFDNYDFNYNIEDRAVSIRNDILSGKYATSQPLIYRIEKKYGICRHLVIPQPSDALVLQILIENVSDRILKKQPSKNAFYSRDKHTLSKPHEVEDYGLTWRQQWKQLQKKIYNFNEEKELIIVTDLSNYYDSIDIHELRKVFTSLTKIHEVIIDLLFKIIEDISWIPDYLPYSKRGLPVANIEGVRLLAHSFLFEIDEVIKYKSKNSFTRWMDDIVIGINSQKDAVETISSVSDMLKSRGLSLNLSKTKIYNADESYYNFQIEENRYIDSIENTNLDDPDYTSICSELYKNYKLHFKQEDAKYWDKVTKRYITTFSRLKSTKLLNNLADTYISYPSLRQHLLYYLINIGFRAKTKEKVLKILNRISIFDDISLYQICSLLTQWEIPLSAKPFLKECEKLISKLVFNQNLPSHFYCLLWFKSKYSHPEDLFNFIIKYENLWQKDSSLRRQITATLSRLLIYNSEQVRIILNNQISSGILNTVTLANQIYLFSKLKRIDFKLTAYLFPKNIQRPYPLSKFLVLCSILNSDEIRRNPDIKDKILANINDPFYLKWIENQYNISN